MAKKQRDEEAAHANGSGQAREAGFIEGRKVGFREGVHHIVMVAEEAMAEELGFTSRQKLLEAGKLPAYWIAALTRCFGDEAARAPKDAKVNVEAKAPQGRKDHG